MKRAERRALARQQHGRVWKAHFKRLPGSLKPFHRVSTLLEEAKKAARARMSAMEKLSTLFNRGFWRNLADTLIPALERRRDAALVGGKEEYTTQDAVLVKAGRALMEYRSRGHGQAKHTPRLRIPSRSKYKPHQGPRECARRLEAAHFTAISAWRCESYHVSSYGNLYTRQGCGYTPLEAYRKWARCWG